MIASFDAEFTGPAGRVTRRQPLRIVAFGGGHGLNATLRALVGLGDAADLELTAVVTVGDDGGSSGRLRAARGVLPPGDLRQALAALAGPGVHAATVAALFQHRFAAPARPGAASRDAAPAWRGAASPAGDPVRAGAPSPDGPSPDGAPPRRTWDGLPPPPDDGLSGHAVGNLVLAGLLEMHGDPVAALDHAAAMVHARGRVLPMSPVPVRLAADIRDETRPDQVITVVGQHAVAICPGHVEAVRLTPKDPPACDAAVAAVGAADWLIFGPGSWYTSVIPHLLVPDLAKAILGASARRLVILNLAVEKETSGLSLSDHLGALTRYLPGLRADVVLADGNAVGDARPVRRAAETLGARLVLAPVAVHDGTPRHDPSALAAALLPVLTAVPRPAR